MPRGPDKLMLLDAPSLYFRAFYGVPVSVTAPDGTPVNAVRGLLDAIAMLLRMRTPTRLVACMDADWRPAFRVAAVPSYKAHRVGEGGGDQTPDELAVQVPVIEEVLAAVGLAQVGAAGYEADDVIGTLAAHADCPVDVVTGDRDLFQVVRDDAPVVVLFTGKGVGKAEAYDEARVAARYGIPGRAYADFATLRGDPSDGLPGVPGVGEKTAASLVTKYGGLAGLLDAVDRGEPGLAKVAAARDYLERARPVVRVATDVAMPAYDDRLPAGPRDPAALVALSEKYRLDTPLNRLAAALGWDDGSRG